MLINGGFRVGEFAIGVLAVASGIAGIVETGGVGSIAFVSVIVGGAATVINSFRD